MHAIRAIAVWALLAVLAGTVATTVGEAREERRKWWQSERVRSDLSLTDVQAEQLERIFQETLPRMRTEKQELDQAEQALSRLMQEAALEDAAILPSVERVEATRARAGTTRLMMLYRMYRVLTPEQRQKLEALHQRQSQGRRDRGTTLPDPQR